MERIFIINFKERIENYDAYKYNMALTFLVFYNFVGTILNLGYEEEFNKKDIYVNNLKCDIEGDYSDQDFRDYFEEILIYFRENAVKSNLAKSIVKNDKNIDLEDIDEIYAELDFINDNLQDFYSILENKLCYKLLKASKIFINCFCNSCSSIISIQGLK